MAIVAHHNGQDMIARYARGIGHGNRQIARRDRARHGGGQILLADQAAIEENT